MDRAFASKIVMIAEMTIKAERLEDFLDYTSANLAISRAYPGNISFEILIEGANPDVVLFHEVWESAEAQRAYMAWRVEAGDLTTLLSMLAAPPRFTAYRSIAA